MKKFALCLLSVVAMSCRTATLETKPKLLEVTPTQFVMGGAVVPCGQRVPWKIQLKFSHAIKPESLKITSELTTWIMPKWSADQKTVDLTQELSDCVANLNTSLNTDLSFFARANRLSQPDPTGNPKNLKVQAEDIQGQKLEENLVLYVTYAPAPAIPAT
jgi:hypothetical protein